MRWEWVGPKVRFRLILRGREEKTWGEWVHKGKPFEAAVVILFFCFQLRVYLVGTQKRRERGRRKTKTERWEWLAYCGGFFFNAV